MTRSTGPERRVGASLAALLLTCCLPVALGGCGLLGGDDDTPPDQPGVVAPSDAPLPVPTTPRFGADEGTTG